MPDWQADWEYLWGLEPITESIQVMGVSLVTLQWDNEQQVADIPLTASGFLDSASGFETSVTISLFTWARANEQDPKIVGQRFGWWGDTFAPNAGDKIGSRLWTLRRAKVNTDTLGKCKAYCLEALQWMLDDGVAKSISVEAELYDTTTIAVKVSIVRKQGGRWDGVWSVNLNEI